MSTTPLANHPLFLITCEHGGNRVPVSYAELFDNDPEILTTHRAYDLGALKLAGRLADRLAAVLVQNTLTRLLVDLNRSLSNRRVFSSYTRKLDPYAREALLERYYHPYRRRVEEIVQHGVLEQGCAIHISVHSFTPRLSQKERNADIGLLYDPRRNLEKSLCLAWQSELNKRRPNARVRRNYPYQGRSDGLTSYLRRRFDPHQYLGIELEVNQVWPSGHGTRWRRFQSDIIESFAILVT